MRINLIVSQKSPILQFAVAELGRYLMLCFPALSISCNEQKEGLNITLSVAEDSYAWKSPPDEPALDDRYHIHIMQESGFIKGSNERSVLIGVYAYLRKLGVRFLRPGEGGEYIPVIEKIESLWVTSQAVACQRHRGVCIEGADSLENILDFIDWLPKLGYNTFFVQFKIPYGFMERWYHHELNPLIPPEPFDCTIAPKYSAQIDAALKKRGVLHHRVGHGWTCEAIGMPALGWIPADQKPDPAIVPLLAQVNGERAFFQGIPMNTNLCYSNKEAQRRMAECIAEYAQQNQQVHYLHIWLADEFNNICECPACQTTSPTDQYIQILNLTDERLTQKGLNTKLVFLLYQELLFAPIKEKLHNPQRFTLMFAPISRTFESSYPTQPVQTALPEYVRNEITLPINTEENLAHLVRWQAAFQGDSFVYDYPLGRAHYGDFGYVSIAEIISRDIKALNPLGLNGYISCQELRVAFPNALPNYVMGYTLFDTEETFADLQLEYFKAAYGDDYLLVQVYLENLSRLSSSDYFNGKGVRMRADMVNRFAAIIDAVHDFQPQIEVGIRSTAGGQKRFWEILAYHGEYTIRLGESLLALSKGEQQEADQRFTHFRRLICENEQHFQSCLDVYRITEVATKYTGFSPIRSNKEAAYVQIQSTQNV